jgi:rhomboid protease GluP
MQPTKQTAPLPPAPRPQPSLAATLRRFPATFGLIGFTALVFLGQYLSQQLLNGSDIVIYYGAKDNAAIASGELWRLLTPVFIHANLLHIFVNMYSLYAIGPAVERYFGAARFLAFYLLAGIAGVVLSLAMSPSPSVGASGAIFGLLGCLGIFLYQHRVLFGRMGAAQLRQIVFVALINLGLGLTPGIDNWGHVGGLIAGSALAWFLGPRFEPNLMAAPDQPRVADQRPWRQVWPGALVALALIGLLALGAMQIAPR